MKPAGIAEATPASATAQNASLLQWSILARLAYGQDWDEPMPPGLGDFRDWAERFHNATTATERVTLEPAGLARIFHAFCVLFPAFVGGQAVSLRERASYAG